MTELQGAVGIAQLKKLPWICGRRQQYGDRLNEGLKGIQGVIPPQVDPEHDCTYWFYMLRLDLGKLTQPRRVLQGAGG